MSVPSPEVRESLNAIYMECLAYLRERDVEKARLFESLVNSPVADGFVKKPIIIVRCRVKSGIKAPHKPLKSQLEFFIKLYRLDEIYEKRAEHLDRIFLRSPDPVDNRRKPFISGNAIKASLPIPQWVFRYTISHLYLEGVKLLESDGEKVEPATGDYVGIRMPHGTECFEYALPESEAKFYIFPDYKFWIYAVKNMDIEYLRDLMKEATIIYTIFTKIIEHRQLRQIAIGSMSRGFGTIEIESIDVIVQDIPVTPIEWIRNVVSKLSGLKQMPKTKTEEKVEEKKQKKTEAKAETKIEQKAEQKRDKFGLDIVARSVRMYHGGTA